MTLIATAANPVPAGGEVVSLAPEPRVALRGARWPATASPPRGTVLLLGGRTEYIEKYFETIGELRDRGFAVATFDWRGQGGSTRPLADPLLGHVGDFAEFDRDLDYALDTLVPGDTPRPLILLAHSMGGNVALRLLARRPGRVAGLIATAPMLAVQTAPFPGVVARALATAGTRSGLGARYVPVPPGPHPSDEPFAGNVVTRDALRHARNVGILKAAPHLALGRPSYGWMAAAYAAMARLQAPETAQRIAEPVLLFSAGQDKIVRPGADLRLVRQLKHGVFVLIGAAEHEILQETDPVRAAFWAAFEAFLAIYFPAVAAASSASASA